MGLRIDNAGKLVVFPGGKLLSTPYCCPECCDRPGYYNTTGCRLSNPGCYGTVYPPRTNPSDYWFRPYCFRVIIWDNVYADPNTASYHTDHPDFQEYVLAPWSGGTAVPNEWPFVAPDGAGTCWNFYQYNVSAPGRTVHYLTLGGNKTFSVNAGTLYDAMFGSTGCVRINDERVLHTVAMRCAVYHKMFWNSNNLPSYSVGTADVAIWPTGCWDPCIHGTEAVPI